MAAKTVQLLTIPQAADRLSCSRGHIYTLIATGELNYVDIAPAGRASKTRIPEGALTAYVEKRMKNARRLHITA